MSRKAKKVFPHLRWIQSSSRCRIKPKRTKKRNVPCGNPMKMLKKKIWRKEKSQAIEISTNEPRDLPQDDLLCCPICNLTFTSNKKSNLTRHLRLHRSKVQVYRCCTCNRPYSTEYNFSQHVERRHASAISEIHYELEEVDAKMRPIYQKIQTFKASETNVVQMQI